MLRGGKRQFGGKIAYAGSIRNRVALLCCHGALGRHLINRFTLGGAPLYRACGYQLVEAFEAPTSSGLRIPLLRMRKALSPAL